MGERQSIQVRTNRIIRRLLFQILNTGNEAIRQSTQRREWDSVDWRIDGEWLPNTDTVWFIFRDDLILPGESRSMEILLPSDVTAIRVRWLAQPASARYRLAWTYPWAFKPKTSQFLMSFIEPEDPTIREQFLTSDPIPLGDRPQPGTPTTSIDFPDNGSGPLESRVLLNANGVVSRSPGLAEVRGLPWVNAPNGNPTATRLWPSHDTPSPSISALRNP